MALSSWPTLGVGAGALPACTRLTPAGSASIFTQTPGADGRGDEGGSRFELLRGDGPPPLPEPCDCSLPHNTYGYVGSHVKIRTNMPM